MQFQESIFYRPGPSLEASKYFTDRDNRDPFIYKKFTGDFTLLLSNKVNYQMRCGGNIHIITAVNIAFCSINYFTLIKVEKFIY